MAFFVFVCKRQLVVRHGFCTCDTTAARPGTWRVPLDDGGRLYRTGVIEHSERGIGVVGVAQEQRNAHVYRTMDRRGDTVTVRQVRRGDP